MIDTSLVIPDAGKWSFENVDVARAFDNHVREQLPWYDLATGIVLNVARQFVPVGGRVADVGASTGNIGRAIQPVLEHRRSHLTAIEPSHQMTEIYNGPGDIVCKNAQDIVDWDYDFVVAFLALMFIPLRERRPLIDRIIGGLRPGGAFVIFDKLVARAGDVGALSLRLTLAAKYEAGAKPDEIIAKELSLAGTQRPFYPSELVGFEPIFRFGDFGGWIIVREPG